MCRRGFAVLSGSSGSVRRSEPAPPATTLKPRAGTPVPGGLTYREGHLIMEMLHDSDLVGSLDVVEVNPYLDRSGETARLAVALISSLFGRKIMARGSVFDQPETGATSAKPRPPVRA